MPKRALSQVSTLVGGSYAQFWLGEERRVVEGGEVQEAHYAPGSVDASAMSGYVSIA